ncbi:MAG: hypothetical protein V9F82_07450 [Dermatophilaceae bacterium]
MSVEQYDHRNVFVYRGVLIVLKVLSHSGTLPLVLTTSSPLRHKHIDEVDGFVEQAAAVVAQVEDHAFELRVFIFQTL